MSLLDFINKLPRHYAIVLFDYCASYYNLVILLKRLTVLLTANKIFFIVIEFLCFTISREYLRNF